MGLCGLLGRLFGYGFIVMIAVLVYFHLECLEEAKKEVKHQFNEKFELEATDIIAELGFCHQGKPFKTILGLDFMLKQWMPCAFVKLFGFIFRSHNNS